MIELSSYPIFTSNLGTLESTSFDDKNGQIMTASQRIVTNFDHVKNVYSRSHHLSEFLTSIDALFNDKNGNLVFVEFKNGFLDKKEQYCLQKKLYDSILILLDTTSEPFSSFREQSKFATVYKGNIIKNLIMDCQSYTKYRPNETTGGIFVSWRRKEELPTGA